MYQTLIEDQILGFIEKKIKEKQEADEQEFKKIIENISYLDEKWKKVEEFQKRHLEELNEIWPMREAYLPFLGYESHMGATFHDISMEYQCCKMDLDRNKKYNNQRNGFVNITYQEIEEGINLNRRSAKKYLDILAEKGEILRKRDVGGFFYKFPEESV